MIALVTGASSGIGRDIARELARRGINVIITARRRERLLELKKELTSEYGVRVKCITADLTDPDQCKRLYEQVRKFRIDILINNAGLGVFGKFTETELSDELEMLDVNVRAFHIIFKLFLKDFKERNYGFILNTASLAGFMPGPLFSSYYASKAYVVRMTQAIAEELRAEKSGVSVSMLCPGPVATEFMDKARVKFAVKPFSSEKLAEKAVTQMFRRKLTIGTSTAQKTGLYLTKLVPDSMLAFGARIVQNSRKRY